MSLNKNLRQELIALAQRCGLIVTEDELKEPDNIRDALRAIRRRLETEHGYAFTTARKVGAVGDFPHELPDISTKAGRENLGEKTLAKIDELQRRSSAQDARHEEDERELITMVKHNLSLLETALGCQLGEGATATVGERFEFLVKRAEKLTKPLTEEQADLYRRLTGNRPESAPEPMEPMTALSLPEEPEEGSLVAIRWHDGTNRRFERVHVGLTSNSYSRWKMLDPKQVDKVKSIWFTWRELWAKAMDYAPQREVPTMIANPPAPVERDQVIEWEDRARVEALPKHAVVRAKSGAIAHRMISSHSRVFVWALAGSEMKYTDLPEAWFPVKVLDAGEGA